MCQNTIGSKIILDTLDRTPSDVGHVESLFHPFRYRVSIGARKGHGLRQTYHMLRNHFGHTRWYFKVMRIKWKLNSVCLEIVLVLTQDTCTVCAKCTIGL
jgi:hypothetical protein